MKKILTLLFLVFLFNSCEDTKLPESSNNPDLRELSLSEARVTRSGNKFAFNLFRAVQDETQPNAFVSPLSISIALGMALNGANDEVRESILSVIDYEELTVDEVNQAYQDLTELLLRMDNKTTFNMANSIWSAEQYTLKQTFVDIIRSNYAGEAQTRDFTDPQTRIDINKWVEGKTKNKIHDLLSSISPDEVLYLINAIYFKSDWKYKFDKSATHKASFTNISGTTSQVNMMVAKAVKVGYYADEKAQFIDVTYGNGQFSMTILIPKENLTDFINELTTDKLRQWLELAHPITAELNLPKFKMKWKSDLKDDLQTLGLKTKGFPNFFQEPLALGISKVVHQSFIEVNEEGSEAAAATAIGIELTSSPTNPSKISIDKPFVFLIREKHSGVILFMGNVAEAGLLE